MDRNILDTLVRGETVATNTEAGMAITRLKDESCPGIFGIWLANSSGKSPSAEQLLHYVDQAAIAYVNDHDYAYQIDMIVGDGVSVPDGGLVVGALEDVLAAVEVLLLCLMTERIFEKTGAHEDRLGMEYASFQGLV
ncbi:hypothetical protein M409DRAFT_20801 [Zasmidium cellare ATCC 36951]|uniref:Uncharacterized protein n=1 Tax=Zasmidium cellare ATCC 36951 TaxID=1080233 RepID=A0A6A6CNV6_ZASCE|nr:uncharacterized protein M409DRAFT_20801 [Zasmidium cellare ATCC 36951]KAF2168785.1 hypothetical protein M409DRAFT_20801 [Zasmidium cellare ATCC 36951]